MMVGTDEISNPTIEEIPLQTVDNRRNSENGVLNQEEINQGHNYDQLPSSSAQNPRPEAKKRSGVLPAQTGQFYKKLKDTKLMNGRSKPQKSTFSEFLYNKNEGTCLGRTAKSWCQITIFYIIFYTILAAFWLGCLYAFLSTTDPQLPRFYGKGTIIGANPGVGYQPWLKEDPESTLIKFNPADPDSYKRYVEVLDKYFAKYENDNNTRVCSGSESNGDIIKDGKVQDGNMTPCRFDLTAFQKAGCMKSRDYGFKDGTPCVVVSLNRLIGWAPESYAAGEVPAEVKSRYKKNNIAFHCKGTHNVDQEHEGPIEYVPPEGIDGRFYPYAVMENYQQPIALIKFKKLPLNRLTMIECQAYAKNIERNPIDGLGTVNFELFKVDGSAKNKKEL